MIWIGVGILLWYRTIDWVAPFGLAAEAALEGSGLLLAVGGYALFFWKVARKNVERIQALPERVCAFAFTAWKGYLMIGLMVTIGITLRNSSVPKEYLVIPYTFMGGMLLAGSQQFLRQFVRALQAK
jgi:hypothetical protein